MTMQKEHPLKQPKHSRENVRITLNIAWPSIVESFFVAFAGLVDSLMVSSLGSYAVHTKIKTADQRRRAYEKEICTDAGGIHGSGYGIDRMRRRGR